MDFSAVHILLCVLIAQAACEPVPKAGAVNAATQEMQKEILSALDHLAEPGLLPTNSCLFLNHTELTGSEQQSLTARNLSFFRCFMTKLSELTPELSDHLNKISQSAQDIERLISGRVVYQTCSLPPFEHDMDAYVYVRCLLKLLDQRISKASF